MNVCDKLPIKLTERYMELFTKKDFQKLLVGFSIKPLISLRTNTSKISSNELNELLNKQNFILERVGWNNDVFTLKNKSARELTETEQYKKGLLYIQNLSSMLPALILNPISGEKILDIAAAPGSKTTHIVNLMNSRGLIVANDISRQRLYKMERILNDYDIPFIRNLNTKFSGIAEIQKIVPSDSLSLYITNLRGEQIWRRFPEYFDKTLVDVPCSMEGRIYCDDPKTYQDWSAKKIKKLSSLQKYLLRSAISSTKIGGTIVYSTCTLSPEENEEVIEWVMEKTPNALTVEKITLPNIIVQNGLQKWRNKVYNYSKNCIRILPNGTMEGFFIAKIKKTASTVPLFTK